MEFREQIQKFNGFTEQIVLLGLLFTAAALGVTKVIKLISSRKKYQRKKNSHKLFDGIINNHSEAEVHF